nr:MAG TPA: hypothetical protein [Caudoviricetes sp.]
MKQPRQPATTVFLLPAGAGTFYFVHQITQKMRHKIIYASSLNHKPR